MPHGRRVSQSEIHAGNYHYESGDFQMEKSKKWINKGF